MMKRRPRYVDEPTMSDKTLLLNVEDLINVAFGTLENNVVDFKLVQTILHILARQMRLLEQDVEIKIAEDEEKLAELQQQNEKYERDAEYYSETTESETSSDEGVDKSEGSTAKKKAVKGTDGKMDKDARQLRKDKRKQKKRDRELAKGEKNLDKEEKKSGKAKASKGKDSVDGRADSPEITKKGEKGRWQEGTKRSLDAQKKKQGGREGDKALKTDRQGSGISITEKVRKGGKGETDKILVVEKGPTTRDSRTRVGSIEVVTRSEFDELESAVEDLASLKGPLPMPTMPDDKKLKSALVKGAASLPDVMEAMQVNARIQAAEKALTCMADLLTQLAAAGAIPPGLADKIDQMKAEVRQISLAAEAVTGGAKVRGTSKGVDTRKKSLGIDSTSMRDSEAVTGANIGDTLAEKMSASIASKMTTTVDPSMAITQCELDEALQLMKTELLKNITNITGIDSTRAESASAMVNSVAEKLDVALKLDERISNLYSLTNDYADQLSGFDSGVAFQMQSFQEQMMQMKEDLKGGLVQLNNMNNNAENAAVTELRSGYETLVTDLDTTLHTHTSLVTAQHQLGDELRGLIQSVEMLREQKADRDEVMDGLRDKAGLNRLNGLLKCEIFEATCKELDIRLELCHKKFQKQDSVWMGAINDLSNIADNKADVAQLMSLRDFITDSLNEIRSTLRDLEILLGEPKAAMIMRQISRNAHCGACLVPALILPKDEHYGAPAPLPPLPLHDHRPPEDEPCTTSVKLPTPPDAREHICHRWVGGSHTLVSEHVTREKATFKFDHVPSRRYAGYGSDGRLYMLEEELQPCVECNQLSVNKADDVPPPSPTEAGGGDHQGRAFTRGIIYEKSIDDTDLCECFHEPGCAD